MDPNERVLCVPRKAFENVGLFQGFSFEWKKYVHHFLQDDVGVFLPRGECETDSNFKQIIPYMMLRCCERSKGEVVWLRYNRTKESGEGRLRGKASVGIGGHINESPGVDLWNTFQQETLRELHEEVRIDATISTRHIGVINDDSDPVGAVHFGIVMEVNLNLPCVYPADETTREMRFGNYRQLLESIEEFEGWSRLCITAIDVGRLGSQAEPFNSYD